MKKADNFDASKWLVENKITTQSRLNEEEQKLYYVTLKAKDGSHKSTLTGLPNHVNQTYSGALRSIERLKDVDGRKGKKYIYYVSDKDGNPLDKDGNIINEESRLNENEGLAAKIAVLPNHHTAEDTDEATLIVGKYAVVHYDESDEGGEDMYVVWDNTVDQDEIGSYDDVPEFESEDPAEVADWLEQNA